MNNANPFHIIVAYTVRDRGIGYLNSIPWKLKRDMDFFKSLSTESNSGSKNAVIMGRNTYNSIPIKFRPLSGRINIVVTQLESAQMTPPVQTCKSLESALEEAYSLNCENVFVIGGQMLYDEAIKIQPVGGKIYATEITANDVVCDTFFPAIDKIKYRTSNSSEISESKNPSDTPGITFQFKCFEKIIS
jgi:dihydrofolate reductase/thymidylate synthase